jgi:hypothetical protein
MMTVYVAQGGRLSLVDPAQRALYARLEEVLGADHAATLMTHLPPAPAARLATADDLAGLSRSVDARFAWVDERFDKIDERFDRLEHRFDKMDDRFHDLQGAMREQMRFYTGTTVAAMTALTAMFTFAVTIIT